ncbi:MAG: aminotransferase [Rhodobacteraceae bacterium]|nr:aminotransferase [Paracoccaceae bacterium]MBR26778.1 aminotransferase [Paracoccaceae bacterium]
MSPRPSAYSQKRPRAYLDWNASAPLRAEARSAALAALDLGGNPSSVHAEGRAARAMLERARAQVAALVGCAAEEVVFASGATEAAGILAQLPEGVVEVEPGSHPCLLEQARTDEAPGRVLAMTPANNETGMLTPIPAAAPGTRVLADVTQLVGRAEFDFAACGADFAILSGHKIGGPKGIGALIVRGASLDGAVLAPGGGQETRRRAGTENLPGIAGFGAAAEAAAAEREAGAWDRVAILRDRLEGRLESLPHAPEIVGRGAPRLPNTTLILARGWRGETQAMQMDLAGYAVSSGSACASGKTAPSTVLAALGYSPEDAACGLRVSIGPATTEAEIDGFADAWAEKHARATARAA